MEKDREVIFTKLNRRANIIQSKLNFLKSLSKKRKLLVFITQEKKHQSINKPLLHNFIN